MPLPFLLIEILPPILRHQVLELYQELGIVIVKSEIEIGAK